ncbi:MAG: hypothetical protein ACE5PT_05240 [Gemmatimonadales bacterium]
MRLERTDSAGQRVWVTGQVVEALRDGMVWTAPGANLTVRFDESTRLQVRRGRRAWTGVGAGLGLTVGVVLGIQTLRARQTELGEGQSSFGPALVRGSIGAVLGGLLGSLVRFPRWETIRLEDGRIPVAPLDERGTDMAFSLSRTLRWERFEPSEPDFHAFFAAHSDNLHRIEGIWTRSGTVLQVAIVRFPGRIPATYGAYRLKRYPERTRTTQDGVMLFALVRLEDGAWELRFPRSPRRYRADLQDDLLTLVLPDGSADRWDRFFP